MEPESSARCKVCLVRAATANGLCDQCRNLRLAQKVHGSMLPFAYRLLLRLPGVSRLEWASGVFWVLVVPILVFLNMLLTLVLLIMVPFPFNLLLASVVPASVFVVLVRLGLERFINLWNLLVASSTVEWDITRSTKEYVEMVKRQEQRKRAKSPSNRSSA